MVSKKDFCEHLFKVSIIEEALKRCAIFSRRSTFTEIGQFFPIPAYKVKRSAMLLPLRPTEEVVETEKCGLTNGEGGAPAPLKDRDDIPLMLKGKKMKQISLKTPNPKCRLFLKIDQ